MRRPTALLALACFAVPAALAADDWVAQLEAQLGADEDSVCSAKAAGLYADARAGLGPSDAAPLLAAAQTYAEKDRPRGAWTAVDLLTDLAARGGLRDPAMLTSLLAVGRAPVEPLVEAYAALPWAEVAPVLSACLVDPRPLVRARAGRTLAEVAPAASAAAVAACVAPLASDAKPAARLAYLQALEVLETDLAPAAAAVAALASDSAWAVATHALRLAAARGVLDVVPVARARLADRAAPYQVRLAACWALARCGDRVHDGERLRRAAAVLGIDDRAVALACWAALDPQAAAPVVAAAIDQAPAEPSLYRAIPLLQVHGAPLVVRNLSLDPRQPAIPEAELYDRRIATLEALSRGPSHPVLAEHLYAFCLQAPADKPTSLGPNPQEFALAVAGLVAQAGEHSRELLANLLLKRRREGQLDPLLTALATLGGPQKNRGLRTSLTDALLILDAGARELEARVGRALSRIDPALARTYCGKRLDQQRGDALEWAQLLARAGDPRPLRARGLAISRGRWERAPAGARRTERFRHGLDLLSAGRHDETEEAFWQVLRAQPGSSAAYNVACAHALAGRREVALRWLRRSVRLGYDDPTHMLLDADLLGLHADPRFTRLVADLRVSALVGLEPLDRAF